MLYEDSEMNDLLNEFNSENKKKGLFDELNALRDAIV